MNNTKNLVDTCTKLINQIQVEILESREEKIKRIKKQIKDGTYKVSSIDIAKAINPWL